MSEINLTGRKKSEPPKILSSHIYDEKQEKYVAKFSEAYREEGHDYNKSFKVLREAYWFKYEILTQDDIATYETLQFLCERGIAFTLEVLAQKSKVGKETLRHRLDNLVNAELLDIFKTDGQGQPNYYLLRTPLFEKKSLDGESPAQLRRKKEIWKAGFEVPEIYLEQNIHRLKRQIKKNRVKKLRTIYKDKKLENLKKRDKSLYARIKATVEEKRMVWFSIVKTIGNQKAANLDSVIWQYAKSDFSEFESTAFNRILREKIKDILQRLNIAFDSFLIDKVESLFHFYAPKIQTKRAGNGTNAAPADNGENADDRKEFLLRVLQARKEKTQNYSFNELVLVFRDALKVLKLAEIEALAKSYFDNDSWQKLTVELRN